MKYYFVTVKYRDGEREYYSYYPMASKLDYYHAQKLIADYTSLDCDPFGAWYAMPHEIKPITAHEYKIAQKLIGFDISQEYMRDALENAGQS